MSSPVQELFGQFLRRYRLAAGYSQERLATLSALGVRTIADLERGVSLFPHPHTVEALANALHLTGSTRASFASAARRPGASASQEQETGPAAASGGPVFVGRASELTAGARFLAGEGPPALLFAGEPGIGKSRLLRELLAQARMSGWRVVTGGCDQRSGREPYAPFVETLDESLLATPPSRRRGDLKECDWLARLGPELAEKIRTPVPEWSLTPAQERRMIFAAARRYLTNIAGPAGTVLMLDDLQWAGLDALDLLAFLVHTHAIESPTDVSPHAALRVLGAYRTSEVQSGHPLENLILDLAHDDRVSLHELARLSEEETRSLATTLVGSAPNAEQWITDAVARADGVPFYLVNFAQAFHPGGDAAPRADASGVPTGEFTTPWLVTATIRRRLSALPPEAQETLALAAVVGRVAPLELLRLALRSLGDDLAASLEAACRARLLEEVSSTVAAYRFTHDLIRETVFASLSKARQALLHRAFADTLEQLPLPEQARHLAALADHLMRAGEPGRALPYVLLAGDQAEAVYGHSDAERHFRMAARLAADLGDRAREAEALEKLGGAIHLLGRHVEAASGWQGALRDYQELHDQLGELRALAGLLLSQAEVGREKLDETVALARTLLARIVPPDAASIPPALASALAAAHCNLGWILWTSGFHADAQVELRQAVALARAANDEAQLALAQFRLLIAGGLEQTAEAFEETLALAERSGQTQMVVTSHNMAGVMYAQAGDFARALAHQEQAVVAAERRRDLRHLAWQLKNFAIFLFDYGDWRRMREVFARADAMMQEADRLYGETWQSPDMPIYRGIFALAEGREEESRVLLEAVIERIAPVAPPDHVLDPICRLAEADLLAGDAEQARGRITTFLHDPHPDPAACDLGSARLLLAWAEGMLGEESLAEARLEALLAVASPLFRVDALRVRGLLATRQQRWDIGSAALDEALERTRAMPFPYAELKALWAYGLLEAARGAPTEARRRLEQALAICVRLGEGLYRNHIERGLRHLAHKA
jgi:transcriptional regulator with XRE-family HTH domain/tetratricopeptide (TPR) repeat protein